MKSDENKPSKKKNGKDLNKRFPEHYYCKHEQGITRKMLDEVVSKQYVYMIDKLQSSVGHLLKKTAEADDLMSAINSAYADSIKQFENNPQKWESMNGYFSYWLVSSWREFRNTSMRELKLSRLHKAQTQHKDESDSSSYFEIPAAEETEATLSGFFGSEEFVTFVHERVYDYIDDCYLDDLFNLREIAIFKVYCVNNYSIERMVKETNFSRTRIISALGRIKKHLATVDFRWEQFHPDIEPTKPKK